VNRIGQGSCPMAGFDISSDDIQITVSLLLYDYDT
jgi:hypothetical protein